MVSLTRPLVLAIDLDESFAKSTDADRAEFMSLFEGSEPLRVIYTSHRSAQQLIQLAADAQLPVPEMFLAESGTSALKGDGTGTIEPLQRSVIQLWPGKETVKETIGKVEGVKLLEDDSPCRQSIEVNGDEALAGASARADEIGCHISQRVGNQYDVLPFGVEKGGSLGRWIVQENINPGQVLAFGQDHGDLILFGRGWRGAVFAHAPVELRQDAARFHNVRVLHSDGLRGVLDGLTAFGWLEMSATA